MAAELAIASAVRGISNFALMLASKLHGFSAITSAASREVAFIAHNATSYSVTLDILTGLLNDNDPIHSKRAVKLVRKLCHESEELFEAFESLIPALNEGRNEWSFAQRVAWNSNKGQVELLSGHVDRLKSTANLLVNILVAGKRVRANNRGKRKSKNTSKEEARIETAILEHIEAVERLTILHARAVEERDRFTILRTFPASDAMDGNSQMLARNQPEILTLSQTLLIQECEGIGYKQLALQDAHALLLQLLSELTTCIDMADNVTGMSVAEIEIQHSLTANPPEPVAVVSSKLRHIKTTDNHERGVDDAREHLMPLNSVHPDGSQGITHRQEPSGSTGQPVQSTYTDSNTYQPTDPIIGDPNVHYCPPPPLIPYPYLNDNQPCSPSALLTAPDSNSSSVSRINPTIYQPSSSKDSYRRPSFAAFKVAMDRAERKKRKEGTLCPNCSHAWVM